MKIKTVLTRKFTSEIGRLEAIEVKEKFDAHNLDVKENDIAKVFRSAAVNRPRNDPCKELSLYEFFIFSKSQKASMDFQQLMDKIKSKMLLDLHNGETIKSEQNRNEAEKLLPYRKPGYIECLPSSFNPLMNHFKDEEKRRDLREQVVSTLENIDRLRVNKELGNALERNNEAFKDLLRSHFPTEELDEQTRKLFSQRKGSRTAMAQARLKRMSLCCPKPLSHDFGQTKRVSMVVPDLGKVLDKLRETDTIRQKTREEVQSIILKAKKSGIEEAKSVLKRGCFHTFTRKNSSDGERTGGVSLKNVKSQTISNAGKLSAREKYTQRLLKERLILRTGSTPGSANTSTQEWVTSTISAFDDKRALRRIGKISAFEGEMKEKVGQGKNEAPKLKRIFSMNGKTFIKAIL